MTSIAQAMLWEYWRRSPWHSLLAAAAMFGFPALCYGALQMEGAIDAAIALYLHFPLLLIQFMLFAGTLAIQQGSTSRLYSHPVGTSTLVAWRMAPAIVTLAASYMLSALLLNACFDVQWPVLGTALFFAAVLAGVQAVAWSVPRRQVLQILGCTLVALVALAWLHTRYAAAGVMQPRKMWNELTLQEVGTLAAAMACAFALAVYGVARDRRGDAWVWPDRLLALGHDWRGRHEQERPFHTVAAAQLWFEWRRVGLAMPIVLLLCGLGVTTAYACGIITAYQVLEGCIGFGGLLVGMAGFQGLMAGQWTSDRADTVLGRFRLTRPMSDAELAASYLQASGVSLLVTTAGWVAALCAATAWLYHLEGPWPVTDLWTQHGLLSRQYELFGHAMPALLVAAFLVAAWSAMGLVSSLSLTGRRGLLAAVYIGSIGLLIGRLLLGKFVLPHDWNTWLNQASAWIIPAACLAAAAILLVAARRRALVSPRLAASAVLGWICLAGLLTAFMHLVGETPLSTNFFWIGMAALPFVSLAAAPLAVHWDRHR